MRRLVWSIGSTDNLQPVRNEDARANRRFAGGDEPRRKSQRMREQSAIEDAQRKGVGGSVRKSRDRNPRRIDGEAIEHPGQCRINASDVFAQFTQDDIPTLPSRGRHHQQNSVAISKTMKRPQNVLTTRAGAMQQQHQGRRLVRTEARRHVKDPVPGYDAERLASGQCRLRVGEVRASHEKTTPVISSA